ncbi:MAG: MarR family winged helix-turn-helix transcriptional regulator [Cytophagales bacterium]|nr:MarR family winged helix-turn-helix transcriptional regulator [Cytophagales bacterium]
MTSLEKEIVQPKFQSENQKAVINIMYTNNYIIAKMNDFFKAYAITRQQYNVLRILRGQYPKPATINLLKERMLDKMSDASRIVKRLRVKQLINRNISVNDRRAAEITISEQGLALLEKMDEISFKLNELTKNLSNSELADLNRLLDKLRE